MNKYDFTAVDIETAQPPYIKEKYICQIGIVVVRDLQIVDRLLYLVQPLGNEYEPSTIKIHHITPEMTADKPTFDKIWPLIEQYFYETNVVAHNSNFDESTIRFNLEYYLGMDYYFNIQNKIPRFIDTRYIYGSSASLTNLCNSLDIECDEGLHHDALYDAECCAQVYIKYLQGETLDMLKLKEASTKNKKLRNFSNKSYLSGDVLQKDLSNADPNNPFYDKKVVLTGEFTQDKKILALRLKSMGADIDTTVGNKTNFLITGITPGPKKLEKAMLMREKGLPIKILSQEDLSNILSGEWENYYVHTDDKVTNHPFYDRTIGLIGTFTQPDKDLRNMLKLAGANIISSITKNLHFVLIGSNPDGKKMDTLEKRIHDGYNIRKLYQSDLDAILSGDWKEYYTQKEIKKDLDFTINHYLKHHISFDNNRNVIASKELYYGKDFMGNFDLFNQITGNLGAFGDLEIYPETNICVLSDATLDKLEKGIKDETIIYIQDFYNKNKSIVFDFQFISESEILDFCKERCENCGDEVTMELYEKYMQSAIQSTVVEDQYQFKEGKNYCKVDGKIVLKTDDGRTWCPSRQFRGEVYIIKDDK